MMLGRAVLAVVIVVTLGGASSMSPATASGPAAHIGVSPSTHLARGDVVTVRIRHLPAGATVELFECDVFEVGTQPPCGVPVAIATTSRRGSVFAPRFMKTECRAVASLETMSGRPSPFQSTTQGLM